MYPFTKPLPFKDEQSDSCPSNDYKPPLVSIKEKDDENMTQGETFYVNNTEPHKNGGPNFPNMTVLNGYGFIGGAFLIPPQEDDVNLPHENTWQNWGKSEHNKNGYPNLPKMAVFIEHDIYGHTFILLPEEDGHKLWDHIVTIIDEHGTKVAHNPVHIHFINSINDDHYENIMSCHNTSNHIVQNGNK